MINLRRNPWLSIAFMAVGGAALGIGLFLGEYIVVALGVMLFGGGGLLMLNPAVTIEANEVVLKNILGMAAVSYEHDGISELTIVDGKLMIRLRGRQAIINRVSKKKLHPRDWEMMESLIADVKAKLEHAKKHN